MEDGQQGLEPLGAWCCWPSPITNTASKSATVLKAFLPDGKVGDIGRDMVPDLRAGDYDGAVTLAVGEIAQVIAADAKITLDNQPAPEAAPEPEHHSAP